MEKHFQRRHQAVRTAAIDQLPPATGHRLAFQRIAEQVVFREKGNAVQVLTRSEEDSLLTFDERGDVLTYTLTQSNDAAELNRLWRAMMLATTAEVLDALLRGESVPIDALDPDWLCRFERKRRAA